MTKKNSAKIFNKSINNYKIQNLKKISKQKSELNPGNNKRLNKTWVNHIGKIVKSKKT